MAQRDLLPPAPPPVRREQKTRDLELFNPWVNAICYYRLDAVGLKLYRAIGPVSLRDAKRIKRHYENEQ